MLVTYKTHDDWLGSVENTPAIYKKKCSARVRIYQKITEFISYMQLNWEIYWIHQLRSRIKLLTDCNWRLLHTVSQNTLWIKCLRGSKINFSLTEMFRSTFKLHIRLPFVGYKYLVSAFITVSRYWLYTIYTVTAQ